MKKLQPTIRYGIYSFIGIAMYFLLMKVLGLEHVLVLRTLNILIVIYFSNKLAKLNAQENEPDTYLQSFGSLFIANAITAVACTVSFAIYITFIDTGFLHTFKGGILFAENITRGQALVSILLEGMAGSVVVSYTLMQFWKVEKPKSKIETSKL